MGTLTTGIPMANRSALPPSVNNPARITLVLSITNRPNGEHVFYVSVYNTLKQTYLCQNTPITQQDIITLEKPKFGTYQVTVDTGLDDIYTITSITPETFILNHTNSQQTVYIEAYGNVGSIKVTKKVGNLISDFNCGALYNWYAASKTYRTSKLGALYNWYVIAEDYEDSIYGAFYNQYAVQDSRNIMNTGWHIPDKDELWTFYAFVGGQNAGGKLKNTGFEYWNSPNGNATNELGFNWKGSGMASGGVSQHKNYGTIWCTTDNSAMLTDRYVGYLSVVTHGTSWAKWMGYSARGIKDSTNLTNGQTGTYTGNDGTVYPTICIGTQEWLAQDLYETKYRNGDLITLVPNWGFCQNTSAMCHHKIGIAPYGWHVPSYAEWQTLINELGGNLVAGGHLKETGTIY
jgi:uncharacterized protein (TIGR02145 family)